MSKKYVIEIENRPYARGGRFIYKATNFNTLVFDQNGLEKLEPYDVSAVENEVWNFVITLFSNLPDDKFCGGAWVEDIIRCNTYRQARDKYEKWQRMKCENQSKRTEAIDTILDAIESEGITVDEFNQRARARKAEREKAIPFA